ncbi:MAG TPA: hypothetical protein VIE87_11565 [Pseudolabrys sp.]
MVSVVNGYVCASSCDAASARAGKDPNAPPGTPPGQSGKTDKKSGLDGQSAIVLGGTLKSVVSAVAPAAGATPSNGSQLLNLLA